jgi:hypothetical protein
MTSLGRRDRGALAGLLVVVLLAALVSVAVDHRRDGGPVLPSAQSASRVVGGGTTGGEQDSTMAEQLAALVTGGGPLSGAAVPVVAAFTAAPSDGAGEVPPPDEPPEVPSFPVPFVPGGQLPPEVRPLTQLAAPLGAEACQYLGLIPLAAALGGALGSAVPVSLADLLPYMRPIFDACLIIGVPDTETSCALDEQIDDGADVPPIPAALGLTVGEVIEGVPLPTPLGVFIDEMEAFERLALGPPAPGETDRFSDRLEAAFDCSQR